MVTSTVTNSLTSIAYGNGSFVIVGFQGTVLHSYTGLSWSKQFGVPTTLFLNSVTYGAGIFIAISSVGDVIQSADGMGWTSQPSLGGYPSQVAHLNNRFIIMDETMWSSVDGTNWGNTWVNPAPDAVTFVDGFYVGVGLGGRVQVSTNGTNWSSVTAYQSSDDLKGIAFGNGVYVTVGNMGVIRASINRTNWAFSSRALSNGGTLYGVEYINGEFVAVGEGRVGAGGSGETAPVLFSGPSTYWYRRNTGSFSTIWDVTYGQGLYVLANSFGIQVSSDGINWTSRSSGLSGQLASVGYLNGLFVLTGWDGGVSTSSDGLSWTKRTTGTTHNLWGATYGNRLYVAVGQAFGSSIGVILTSSDAVTWTNRSTASLRDVCYGNGLFVAVGDGGHIRTSANGVNWTTRISGTTVALWGVGYGDGHFIAVGDQGTLLSSPDGGTWTRRNSTTAQSLQRVAYGRGTFVVTGTGSTILQSSPTIPTLNLRQFADASGYELNLVGGLDRTYTVETSEDLAAGSWITWITLLPGQRQTLDSDVSSPQKFYRLTSP
jgi:hypothetical protein